MDFRFLPAARTSAVAFHSEVRALTFKSLAFSRISLAVAAATAPSTLTLALCNTVSPLGFVRLALQSGLSRRAAANAGQATDAIRGVSPGLKKLQELVVYV